MNTANQRAIQSVKKKEPILLRKCHEYVEFMLMLILLCWTEYIIYNFSLLKKIKCFVLSTT